MKSNEQPSREILDAWHDDPSNWKLGIFYFNRKDTRIFPPKRIQGLGWTVNFAHSYSYMTLLGIIILLLIIGFYLK
jgi:uncharacterized membrane protein